jgi:hypothetical protein
MLILINNSKYSSAYTSEQIAYILFQWNINTCISSSSSSFLLRIPFILRIESKCTWAESRESVLCFATT